jgi:hypothetical protein
MKKTQNKNPFFLKKFLFFFFFFFFFGSGRAHKELEKIKTTFEKMLWKLVNNAWKHQLRIENWPAALKEMYPGPGFSLSVITERDNKKEEKSLSRLCLMPLRHFARPFGRGNLETP